MVLQGPGILNVSMDGKKLHIGDRDQYEVDQLD